MEDMMKEQNAAVNEAAEYLDQIPKFSKEKHTVETVREMLKILGTVSYTHLDVYKRQLHAGHDTEADADD